RDALAVDHDPRLRQVDLEIRVDVEELAAAPAGFEHRGGRIEQLLERSLALQHELDVVLTRRRQRRIETRVHAQARNLRRRRVDLAENLLRRARALRPRPRDEAAET